MEGTDFNREKKLSARLLYIAGNGRSGSTLLDLVLGSNQGCFSAGELTFVTRDGILEEYCGCGEQIGACRVWRQVLSRWHDMQPLSLVQYRELRSRFESTRSLPTLLRNLVRPSRDFRSYCDATEALFLAIEEVTNATTIIDSSKTPGRIRILTKFTKPTVLHICRNFSGVLNSMSKGQKKDPEKGVEAELRATPPGKALVSWLMNNLLTELLRGRLPSSGVHYRDLVSSPGHVVKSVDSEFDFDVGEGIAPHHMLAGNRMRLKSDVTIDPDLGFQYRNLTPGLARFGRLVDSLFWFWSKG